MLKIYNIKTKLIVALVAQLFMWGCAKEHLVSTDPLAGNPDPATKFVNPIQNNVLDPYVVQRGGYSYVLSTGPNYLIIKRLQQMIYIADAYTQTVFTPPAGSPYSSDLAKPEMHFINGKWYIYFTADNGSVANTRIFALENKSADPLLGTWQYKNKVADTTNDLPATDGTVLQYNNQLYFIWSGIQSSSNTSLSIYIAKMSNPWTITGPRVLISSPTSSWEEYILKNTAGDVVEDKKTEQNPEVLTNKAGNVFVTFTGNSCESDNLGLGLLTLKSGGDPLNPTDWTKSSGPVFSSSRQAYEPGFNGFFKSPNGAEDWLIYTANTYPEQGCGVSGLRIQKFTWNTDGTPNFGIPVGVGGAPTDTLARPAR